MDSRGHGRSSFDETPISYEVMASDVLGLMDHLGLEKADIVGWSDGAIIGLNKMFINKQPRSKKRTTLPHRDLDLTKTCSLTDCAGRLAGY